MGWPSLHGCYVQRWDTHMPWMQDPTAPGCRFQPDAYTEQGHCGDDSAHLGAPFSMGVGSLEAEEDVLSIQRGCGANGDEENDATVTAPAGVEDGRELLRGPANKRR